MMIRQRLVFLDGVTAVFRSKLAFVAVSVACVALAACTRSSSEQPHAQIQAEVATRVVPLDASSLKQLLERCDVASITSGLKDVLGSPAAADVLAYLNEAWGSGDPKVSACLQREIVRVYAANTLAQAHANRMLDVTALPSVLEALRGLLSSRNSEVAQLAMMGLGDFLTDEDVTRVSQIATGANPGNARVAVSTLALSCTPSAGRELDRFIKDGETRLGDEADKIRRRVQDARAIKCRDTSRSN